MRVLLTMNWRTIPTPATGTANSIASLVVVVVAKGLATDTPKEAKYFLNIDSRMLSPTTAEDGKREVRLDVALCSFDRSGKALQYMQDTVDQKFEAAQFSAMRGIPH